MKSDTLRSLNTYKTPNDIVTTSDRNIYLYCHTFTTPTTPSSQDIRLNIKIIYSTFLICQLSVDAIFIQVIILNLTLL